MIHLTGSVKAVPVLVKIVREQLQHAQVVLLFLFYIFRLAWINVQEELLKSLQKKFAKI